ncbi:MAG: DUF192 domain-containing protein [Candidatus Omnitrophota bacterium]
MRQINPIIVLCLSISLVMARPVSYAQENETPIIILCGGAELSVEIAADPKSRDYGLMNRESLPKGSGMLFVYPSMRACRLWMKNTYIPLSAAFIDIDGRILEIIDMEKINSAKIYRSNAKAKYALEVPLGWFAENGVNPGDYCDIPDIKSR